MNLPKAKATSRKFYGKWLYKVSLSVEGASIFRSHTLTDVIDFCNDTTTQYSEYTFKGRAARHKSSILQLALFLNSSSAIWSNRIESEQIDYYTNDKSFYDALSTAFCDTVLHRFEPAEGSNELLESTESIIVKKLPHNKYNYRVYLMPHKMAGDKEGKTKYIEWLKLQERITCTPAIQTWFYSTDWNWDRRYVLVEDEQTLLMLKLRNADVVGRIYKFVVSDK